MNMMGIIEKTRSMVMESLFGQMAINTEENMSMMREMDKVK
jgi:hypothetical protein